MYTMVHISTKDKRSIKNLGPIGFKITAILNGSVTGLGQHAYQENK